jgi:3-phenylpropionate/trans-cinnamate dioxygenase ferredoxin reductase component
VDFLLIGGYASAHCAATLRRQGEDGSILLVGREPHVPYERPPLSKEFLRGEAPEQNTYVNSPEWYGENDVELLTETNVMSLDVGERTAKLQSGEQVRFGKALIATGARVNILHHLDGAQLEGIHYLRTIGNSEAIREDAKEAGHVVLIGGSFIGC